jgi:hypothetical protein
MGVCTTGFFGYWSSTPSRDAGNYWYYIPFNNATGYGSGGGMPSVVRCVIQE